MKHHSIKLIGGSGRSGTTLLARIFSKHSQAVVAPEWRFLIDPDGILDFIASNQRWSPYHFDKRVKELRKLLLDAADVNKLQVLINRIVRTGILSGINRVFVPRYNSIASQKYCPNYRTFVANLCDELTEFRFSGYWVGFPLFSKKEMYYSNVMSDERIYQIFQKFIYSIVEDVTSAYNANFYVEKNTWNILWFDEINSLLPQAKLVHIYRDPRDVVASYSTQTWMPSDIKQCATIYKNIIDRWAVIKSKVPQDRILEISLEELVEKPEEVLKEVTAFWDMPWEEVLLSTDLSHANSGRWKKQLNNQQQQEVNSILGDCLNRLGYE